MASKLQKQLALKEAECESLRQQAASIREAAAQAMDADHRELQRLEQELFEQRQASIRQMKEAVLGTTPAGAGEGVRTAVEQLQAENRALQQRLEQAQEAFDCGMSTSLAADEKDELIATLQSQLEATWQASLNQGSERCMTRQLAAKDRKVEELRLAIRDLESKLAQALRHNDEMLSQEAYEMSLPAPPSSGSMPPDRAQVLLKLTATQRQLQQARAKAERKDQTLIGMQSLLEDEERLTRSLRKEIANERELCAQIAADMGAASSQPQENIGCAQAEGLDASGECSRAVQARQSPRPVSGAVSNPQLEAWQQQKLLQKKVAGLTAKLKEKSEAAEALLKQNERLKAHVSLLKNDILQQNKAVAGLQDQLKAASDTKAAFFTAAQVQDLVCQIGALEETVATLEAQNKAARQAIPGSAKPSPGKPVSAGPAQPANTEIENRSPAVQAASLLDLVSQRDQAQATVACLRERLFDLFGPDAARLDALASQPSVKGRPVSGAKPSKEAQLEATVAALQRGLERAQKQAEGAVSAAKHTQLLEKKKELQRRLAQAEAEAGSYAGARETISKLERRCQHLQRMNLMHQKDARAAQRELQRQAKAASASQHTMEESQKPPNAEASGSQEGEQKPDEQEGTKHYNEESSVRIVAAVPPDVVVLRGRLAAVEEENRKMRESLSSLDPEFFEEIEDLKHEHHVLKQRCLEYDVALQRLASGMCEQQSESSKASG